MKKFFIFIIFIAISYSSYSDNVYIKLTSLIDVRDEASSLSNIRAFSFYDKDHGVLSHLDKYMQGTIMKLTSDGGKNWKLIYCDTAYIDSDSIENADSIYIPEHSVKNIKYFSDGTIIAISELGKVLRSTDYGNSFSEYIIPNIAVESFLMQDKNFAIITSTAWGHYEGAEWKQLISTDGCESWKELDLPEYIPKRTRLYIKELKDEKFDIWYFNKDIPNVTHHVITDKRLNDFRHIETTNEHRRFCLINDSTFICGGKHYAEHTVDDTAFIDKSTDGGKTWKTTYLSTYPYFSILSIDYINDSMLVATGESNHIVLSTDQGETWFRPEIEYYNGAKFGSRFYNGVYKIDKDKYALLASWFVQLLEIEFVYGTSSVADNISISPGKVYPNPISSTNTITYEFNISHSGKLKTYISDISGKEIAILYDDYIDTGDYVEQYQLPASLSSGSYLLVSEINGFQHTKLLNIVR